MSDYDDLLRRYRKWLQLPEDGTETLEDLVKLEMSSAFYRQTGRQFLSHHNLETLIKYVTP